MKYIEKKDFVGAKGAIDYFQYLEFAIGEVEKKFEWPRIDDRLHIYVLDPAIQRYMTLRKKGIELSIKAILRSLDYSYAGLKISEENFEIRQEPAYMEKSRQILSKFASDDLKYELLLRRAKRRVAKIRNNKQM